MVNGGYIDTRETHSGAVIMIGDHAFKLKKPVDLGFLDFRDPVQRRLVCRRELELNRRLAPDVYLGIGELQAPGMPTEPSVMMRRMPDASRLATLVGAGVATPQQVRDIARTIVVFHTHAQRGPEISAEGTRDALSARWEASFTQCRTFLAQVLDEAVVSETEALVRSFLAGRSILFAERIQDGRVLDGHGDLMADDIFCLPDGPRILDCLEFDDRLRYVDQLDDVAFLAMDLEHLGDPALAAHLLSAYVEYGNDPAPPALLHHYLAYRAFVRAKVSGLRSTQSGADRKEQGVARRFAALALNHLRQGAVALVLVGGPPGSGKSTLAGDIADRLGMVVLGSDRVRKELAGLDPGRSAATNFEEGIYGPAWTDRTYAELLRRAEGLLARGESVVLDATWRDAGWRDHARDVAERTTSELVSLRCELDVATAASRLAARREHDEGEVSDADATIARRIRGVEDPWSDAVGIDTTPDREECAARAVATVRPPAPSAMTHVRRSLMAPD